MIRSGQRQRPSMLSDEPCTDFAERFRTVECFKTSRDKFFEPLLLTTIILWGRFILCGCLLQEFLGGVVERHNLEQEHVFDRGPRSDAQIEDNSFF